MRKFIVPTLDGRRMEYSMNLLDNAIPFINKRIERGLEDMSKQELVKIYHKLDQEKFKLLEKGVAFNFIIRDKDGYLNTGIGTGADMSMMNIYNLITLYMAGAQEGTTIDQFAESVKETLIKAYNDNIFDIKENK